MRQAFSIWTVQRIFLLWNAIYSVLYQYLSPLVRIVKQSHIMTFLMSSFNIIQASLHLLCLLVFESNPEMEFIVIISYLQQKVVPQTRCFTPQNAYLFAMTNIVLGLIAALSFRMMIHRFYLQAMKSKVRAAKALRLESYRQVKERYYMNKHRAWEKRHIYQNHAALTVLFIEILNYAITRRVSSINMDAVRFSWFDHLLIFKLLSPEAPTCINGAFLFSYCFGLGLIVFNSVFSPFFEGDKLGEESEREEDLWTEDSH